MTDFLAFHIAYEIKTAVFSTIMPFVRGLEFPDHNTLATGYCLFTISEKLRAPAICPYL
jgi:hypothetical protein